MQDPAVWAETPAGLETDVLKALRSDRGTAARRKPTPRWLLAAAASVVAVGLLLGGGLLWRDGGSPEIVAALSATDLAPGAAGEVRISPHPSGFEVRLDVDGLPPAPAGSYYQGWLKGPSGSVTVGTFHAREGAEDIVLWSGVDVDDYPELTVTLQRAGAGTASSGRVVLRADIG